MRVGVFVSETWDAASPLSEVRERAQRAEALGLASGWVPYLPWALDALASLQAAGEVTRRIELGSAVIPTFFFHPLALARQAATVQAAIGRPLTLGIGCSNQFVVEMHGLAYERPAQQVREYLELLARAAAGSGRADYQGEIYHTAALYAAPGTSASPVLVGALGPQMLRIAGELSDGAIGTCCNERAIERELAPALRRAASAAGRGEPRVATVVPVALVSDAAAARERAEQHFRVYDGLPRYRRMVELGGARSAADVCAIGGESELRRRLRGYRDAGLTDLLAAPFAAGEPRAESWERTVACLAALAPELA